MKIGGDLDILISEKITRLAQGSLLPRYSRHIEAAWEVVECMNAKGFDDFSVERTGHEWDAYFMKFNETMEKAKEGRGASKNPAHAICLAALEAINSLDG